MAGEIIQGNEGQVINPGMNTGGYDSANFPAWTNLAQMSLKPNASIGSDGGGSLSGPQFSNTPRQGFLDPATGQLWDSNPSGPDPETWRNTGVTSDNGFLGGLADFAKTPGVAMLLATALGAGGAGQFGDLSGFGGGAGGGSASMWNADTLDSSLIGPNAGAAAGSSSVFAPGMGGPTGGDPGSFDPGGELFTPPQGMDRSLLDLNATASNANLTSPSALQQLGFNPNFPSVSGSAGDFSLDEMLKKMRANPFNTAMGAFSVGSGIYGMMQSRRMQALAEQAMSKQDPFGSQRGGYQAQLAALMGDPSSVTSMPGYQFGLDQGRLAIQRRAAASGGGGNEDIALARFTPEYAQNFYGAQQQRLAQLAGAGIAPGSGGTLLAGANSSNDILSRSLASIAYGGRQLGT